MALTSILDVLTRTLIVLTSTQKVLTQTLIALTRTSIALTVTYKALTLIQIALTSTKEALKSFLKEVLLFRRDKKLFWKNVLLFWKDKMLFRKNYLLFRRDKLLFRKNVLLLQKDKRLFRKDNCLFLMNFCLFLLGFKDYLMAIHPKKRMKVKSGHERLVLDVRPLLAARGIINVFTFLKKNIGLPNAFAHDLTHGRAYRISNLYLELLCTKLNCTPNDLFIFKEDPKQSIGEHHALAALYQNTLNPTLLQKLKTLSPQELKAFYEQLDKV